MIYLITGTPGAGKTLYTVNKLINELLPLGRPVWHNINGLSVESDLLTDCGPEGPDTWQNAPDGTIFIFDEIQNQWGADTRNVSESIKALNTHRHRGMDFYLVSQSPMLLNSWVRRLVQEHTHLHRKFGIKGSVVRRYSSVNDDPRPPVTYDDGEREIFKFPKNVFQYYKSAEIHTDKPRVPWVILRPLLIAFFILSISAYFIYRQFHSQDSIFYRETQSVLNAPREFNVCLKVVQYEPEVVLRMGNMLWRPGVTPMDLDTRPGYACWNSI